MHLALWDLKISSRLFLCTYKDQTRLQTDAFFFLDCPKETGPIWQLCVGGLTLKFQPDLSLKVAHSDKYVHNGMHLNYTIKPIISKMHRL